MADDDRLTWWIIFAAGAAFLISALASCAPTRPAEIPITAPPPAYGKRIV